MAGSTREADDGCWYLGEFSSVSTPPWSAVAAVAELLETVHSLNCFYTAHMHARNVSAMPCTLASFDLMAHKIIAGLIARSASRRYLIYSEADLRFFALQGRHVAPMGVKFGTERA